MMKRSLRTLALGMFAAIAVPASAHHSMFSTYQQDKELALSGTVKDYLYVNPHVRIELNAAGNGKAGPWVIETESPLVLRKAGITGDTLKPGDRITVRIHPAKDGKKAGALIALEKEDGTQLSLRGRELGARRIRG